jgi:hypothetical protein
MYRPLPVQSWASGYEFEFKGGMAWTVNKGLESKRQLTDFGIQFSTKRLAISDRQMIFLRRFNLVTACSGHGSEAFNSYSLLLQPV